MNACPTCAHSCTIGSGSLDESDDKGNEIETFGLATFGTLNADDYDKVYSPLTQPLGFQRIRITNDGMKLVPLPLRYGYPPELDLMARLTVVRMSQSMKNRRPDMPPVRS